jgi:hypothetical protein
VRKLAPERPRDVFAGQPLVMTVELDPCGGELEVRGRLAGAAEAWVRRLEVPAGGAVEASASVSASPLPLGALYGREAIADAETELVGRGASGMLEKIEHLGMRHRIASSRTSLVAIADEPGVDPSAPRRRERLAVEVPMGVSAAGAGLMGRMVGMPRAAARGFPGVRLMGSVSADLITRFFGGFADHSNALEFQLPISIHRVTVIRMEKRILELEFETPLDGFAIPAGEVSVLVGKREVGKASVIPGRSTRGGPVAKGLLVRLALELRHGRWQDWHDVEISWSGESGTPDTFPWPIFFELSVTLAPTGGESHR